MKGEYPVPKVTLEQRLRDAIATFDIVDAHEHLPPEKEYLADACDGLDFFLGYVWGEMVRAGMPPDIRATMSAPGCRTAEEWWPQIRPWWAHVQHGSYARPLRIAARDLYGIEDINDQTIRVLADRIQADHAVGLYQRVLGDRCHIRVALSVALPSRTQFPDDPLLRAVLPMDDRQIVDWQNLVTWTGGEGGAITSLDDAADALEVRCRRAKAEGTVGFKVVSCRRDFCTEIEAQAAFARIKAGTPAADAAPVRSFLFDRLLTTARDLDLPVAVHAGVWGDFRDLAPTWILPWVTRHPETRFDLFHLGIPYVREAMNLAKNFRNVSLNLCWCYMLSERMTEQALDEILDFVPLNKVIAFGGDYRMMVQRVYGHLVMARETVARVLARRVAAGDFREERAVEITRMWFCENPSRIYHV